MNRQIYLKFAHITAKNMLLFALTASILLPMRPVVASGQVTDCGSPAAFINQVAGGGSISFNCGANPPAIVLTAGITIAQDTTIDGAGAITLSGGGATPIFEVSPSATLTLSHITLSHAASASKDGGAILNRGALIIDHSNFTDNQASSVYRAGAIMSYGPLTVTNSQFSRNSAGQGGALYIASGTARLTRSTFTGNSAEIGGAIEHSTGDLFLTDVVFDHNVSSGGGASSGGALSLMDGQAALANVTLSDNQADFKGGAIAQANGNTSLTNVTLSGNSAGFGGGIEQEGGALALTNVTLFGNSVEDPTVGGGLQISAGTLNLVNTLVVAGRGANCNFVVGAIISRSFSLSSDSTCGFGAGRDEVAARLGPLADNGGFTLTHMPLPGSPAIDQAGPGCPATDQRGITRPQGAACDVGAVEYRPGETSPRIYLPVVLR